MNEPMLPKGSADLYKKAVDIHKKAYKKSSWSKEKYSKMVGHMMQMLYGKHEYDDTIDGEVDICFDDVHACALAHKNLIVKMK